MTYYATFASPGRPPTPPFGPGPYGQAVPPPGSLGGRRPRRLLSAFAASLLAGVVELLAFLAVARWLGPALAILLMIATSMLGVWLLRREGAKSWRSFRESLLAGRPPGPSATEGLLVLVGGVLMVLPGFVSDVIGALLVAPPTRRLAARWAESALARRLTPSAATSLFGPQKVRVRTGTPQPPPPGSPTMPRQPSGASAESAAEPIEGEIIDPR